MPVYSLPGNYKPVLFESKMCNCFRFFNDAYVNLQHYLELCVNSKKVTGSYETVTKEADKLASEIRRGFVAACIILGDDDKELMLYRSIFTQYAYIGSLLEDSSYAARFFDHRWSDRKALPMRDMDFYMKLSKAASRPGETALIDERDVPEIGNLAMFAAMSRGFAICESHDYLQLNAYDFLLRYIISVSQDDSPLLAQLGSFSWLNLPEPLIYNRPMLFYPAIHAARYSAGGELDTGKRYVLKNLLSYFKDYAFDEESAAYFRLGYECYNQLFEESTTILDKKAREFELYHLYGGARGDLPDSWHFKHLLNAGEEDVSDKAAFSCFNKNEFSQYEIDIIEQAVRTGENGFIESLADQIYYFNPMKGFTGCRKLKFTFKEYPRFIYADFVQYSENAVNYFWLPEMPAKVLNAADNTEFYMTAHIKKLREHPPELNFSTDKIGELPEPFLGIYMYGYAKRLLEENFRAEFFEGNQAFARFIGYLRNLPRSIALKTITHLLKYSAVIDKVYTEAALDQLVYISATTDTLKRVIGLSTRAGKHAKTLLDSLGLPPDELYRVLGERDFTKLVSSLIDWESGTVYFNRSVAEILEKMLRDSGRFAGNDEAVYLSTSYALYNFETDNTFGTLTAAAGILFPNSADNSAGSGISPDMTVNFLILFLNAKLERRQFDESFFRAFERLWVITGSGDGGRNRHREQASIILSRLLTAGDSPGYIKLAVFYQKISESSRYDSCMINEFLLCCKIRRGEPISDNDISRMKTLYQTQGVVTARTKIVADALFAGEQWLFEELVPYEWVSISTECSDVFVSDAFYGDYMNPDMQAIPLNDLEDEFGNSENRFTYLLEVGYVNIFKLNYTADGAKVSRTVRRGLTENPWKRKLIFRRAKEFLSEPQQGSEGFLLMAGRLCVDEDCFEPEVLFAYAGYAATSPAMRQEFMRAAIYILAKQNALTKACLYAEGKDAEKLAGQLKQFYKTCFTLWDDLKDHINIKSLFAYIRTLERIAGAEKLMNLYDFALKSMRDDLHIKISV